MFIANGQRWCEHIAKYLYTFQLWRSEIMIMITHFQSRLVVFKSRIFLHKVAVGNRALSMRALTPQSPRSCEHSSLVSSAKPSRLMVSPWRRLTRSSTSIRCSSQTVRAPGINLARSSFSHLQSCLWSRREILLRKKGRVYLTVVRLILLYVNET